MDNGKLEILIKVKDEEKPRKVLFNEMYPLREKIDSLVFLWKYNSYYINIKKSEFIINGGMRIAFPRIKDSRLVYRKRTAKTVSVAGGAKGDRVEITWIIGIENGEGGEMILLNITELGNTWCWANTL